jgi:hypothetical protein
MRLFALLCACILSTTAFAEGKPDGHLSFARGSLHARLNWITQPQANRESVLAVQWMNPALHAPTEPGAFSAQLWMPSMGHGSSPVTIQRVTNEQGQPEVGAFRISRIFFVMEGDWEIRFTLTHADGSMETVAWPVTVGAGQ